MGVARRSFKGVLAAFLLVGLGMPDRAGALVTVTDSDDFLPFFNLYRPTGEFDETGLSGFKFLISSRTGEFRANDQYLICGEETAETTSLGNNLGAVADLSSVPFAFSIQQNLVGDRNFTFRLTDLVSSEISVLCWGLNCPIGSNATEILNGIPPISDYNGIQIQVWAQDVAGSSAGVTITALNGVTVAGAGIATLAKRSFTFS